MTFDPKKKAEIRPIEPSAPEWKASMAALDDGSLLTLEPDDLQAHEILARWDELSPAGLERLERQPRWAQRLDRLRRAERWLAGPAGFAERIPKPDEDPCPPADELYDFGRGPGYRPLTVERRHAIETHLERCASCEASVETLELSPPLPLELGGEGVPEPTAPSLRPARPRPRFGVRHLVPLAAALLVAWVAFGRLGGAPERGPFETPLLRGEAPDALLFPRGPVLAAEAGAPWSLFAAAPVFELTAIDGASRYWVVLQRHDGGAFAEGDAIARVEGPEPLLACESALAPGFYTWTAWAEIDGLDRLLGAHDFQVVEAGSLWAELADMSPEQAVERLQRARFWSDARALARRLPPSAERDAILRWAPPR